MSSKHSQDQLSIFYSYPSCSISVVIISHTSNSSTPLPIVTCSQTFFIYLFLRFAGVSYGRFIAVRFGFTVNVYSEPLVMGRRGEI